MTISLNGQRRCPLGTTLRQLLPLPCLIMFCVVLGCHLANKAQSFRVICFSDSADDYVNELQGRLRKTFYLVRRYLGKTATRRKEQYDVKIKPNHFSEGDWVWYFCPRKRAGLPPKWQKWYNGPYLVVKVIDSVTCVIRKNRRSKSIVLHKDKLKQYVGETPETWSYQRNAKQRDHQDTTMPSKLSLSRLLF